MLFDQYSRPLRDLRISVTDRCNFRCHYCMPADIFGHDYVFLNKAEILSFEEIQRLVRLFAGLGVSKVRLTGGEPLLRRDLHRLVAGIAEIAGIEDIALTTNGHFLAEHAALLRSAGLRRLTVSLDTLKPDRLRTLAGPHSDLERILGGLEKAKEAGFRTIKINAVIQRGVNDDEILALASFARQRGYIIRFIEYMDVGTLNSWKLEHVVPAREIVGTIASAMPVRPLSENYRGEVANRYGYTDGPGEFGVIASVTQPFCGDCTRIRLSADGKLYTCLFAEGGTNLKVALRSGATDDELRERIAGVWQARRDRYSQERSANTEPSTKPKVEMYQIGG